GAVPGLLKTLTGAHEVMTTIMLNFIAAALLGYLGTAQKFFLPETQHTAEIARSAWLPRLERFIPALHGSPVNLSLLLGWAACGACAWLIFRSRFGYELR